MIPSCEPEVRGPLPIKNWLIKSECYKRPKITSWMQMANVSEQRWANERQAYKLMKRHDYKEIRQEKGHIYRYCKTCTESKANDDRGVVAHLHYSTLQDRCSSLPDFYRQFH